MRSIKKSGQVSASLIVAMAAGLTNSGCRSTANQCVDQYGRRIADADCRAGRPGAHWIRVQTGGFGTTGSGGFFGG